MFTDFLLETMRINSSKEAMIWNGETYSYAWVLERIRFWEKLLQEKKIGEQVVSIEGDCTPSTLSLLIAFIENADIVVPISSAEKVKKEEFIEVAQVQKRFVFSQDRWSLKTISSKRGENVVLLDFKHSHHPGLILFTSGSTGKNKAVLHDFVKLLEKYKKHRRPWRSFAFLLFDHIGGINTILSILSSGGCLITIQDRDPENVCRAIQNYKVELLPTSPTFLNLLLISEMYKKYDLSSLKLVTYGTEPMPEITLKRLNEVLSNAKFKQTYGLTEIGIMRSHSRDDNSLWVKIGGEGFQTKIVDNILWIRAESAMVGYLNAPSPFDAEGWFNTEDEVEIDGDYIKILGRKTEIINVGGQKVYPMEVENVLLQMENVKDVVVKGEKNSITGNIVIAIFNLKKPENVNELKRKMRLFCKGKIENYKIPVKVIVTSEEQFNERYKKIRRDRLPGERT